MRITKIYESCFNTCCSTLPLSPPHAWAANLMLRFSCSRQQERHAATASPAGVPRRMERNRQKLVGRDKGSLTEQQTKGTGATTVQIRRKHNTNRTAHRAALLDRTAAELSRAVSDFLPLSSPPPERMVWNTLLCLSRWGQPARLCPFLDSGEN